jgi:mono/diheme cytochrome c family protein
VHRLGVGLLLPVFLAGYLAACGSTAPHLAAQAGAWRTSTATVDGLTVTVRCKTGPGTGECKTVGRPPPFDKIKAAILASITAPVARWLKLERLPRAAHAGAVLFAEVGCTACHTYLGVGSRNLDAPDLSAIGGRHLGIPLEIRHLRCPSCVVPGSPMPHFNTLGTQRLHELAVFLEDSKGRG